MSLLRALRYAWTSWRFRRLTRHIDRQEADARRRGDTRAVGNARAARRALVHSALRGGA